MPENKNLDFEQNARNLKKADSKKSHNDSSQLSGLRAELFGTRKISERNQGVNVKVKRKLPVAVDIIAGILMLVLTCAVIIGSYMLFRYYSDDYDGVNVTYVAAIEAGEDIESFEAFMGGELFMDVNSNSVYFGRVTNVEIISNEDKSGGQVLLTVSAGAKHRGGEGYSIGDSRLAVGGRYSLRCLEKRADVTVIELSIN